MGFVPGQEETPEGPHPMGSASSGTSQPPELGECASTVRAARAVVFSYESPKGLLDPLPATQPR